jgi:hypothetical protein
MAGFDATKLSNETIKALAPIVGKEDFNRDVMRKNSAAAGNLCLWIVNLV